MRGQLHDFSEQILPNFFAENFGIKKLYCVLILEMLLLNSENLKLKKPFKICLYAHVNLYHLQTYIVPLVLEV